MTATYLINRTLSPLLKTNLPMNSFFKNYPPTITHVFLAVYAMLTLSHLTAINFPLALNIALFLVTLVIIALIVSTISILTKSTFHVMLLFKNHYLHPSPTLIIPLPIPDLSSYPHLPAASSTPSPPPSPSFPPPSSPPLSSPPPLPPPSSRHKRHMIRPSYLHDYLCPTLSSSIPTSPSSHPP